MDEAIGTAGRGPGPQDRRWELPDYDHVRELGAGAAGRVVLAHHRATGTPVAVKYLAGDSADHQGFRAEAELLGALRSPYIAQLYEYVESPYGPAIVMELVDGISLRDLLRAEGATGPEAALTVLKGSLLGLVAAHEAGVVHRDYKPGNVLVATDGSSKLVDFGIAVRNGSTGAIAGTPAYMAPEQWAGHPAAPSGDVYAATATFFECLTGAKPYAGTTLIELAVQHTEAEIPAELAPEPLRPLILAGLAKSPQQRPDRAALLVEQLEAVAGAAYGPDWEARGRHRLAALVALLPMLLPYGGAQSAGGTSFATTTLQQAVSGPARFGKRAKLASAAVGVVLVAGTMAGVAVAGAPGSAGSTEVALPKATTTLGAAAGPAPSDSGTPSAPADPSASPSVSPSVSASTAEASASSSATVAAPPSSGTKTPKPTTAPTVTATVTPTSVPPTPTLTPTVPAPVLTVLYIRGGASCSPSYMTVSGTVGTDGAADGVLTLTWTSSNSRFPTTHTVPLPKGQRTVKFSDSMPFGAARSLTVRLNSTPAATQGGQGSTYTLDTITCNPPR
ncbi:serine/threonine-protein kinase [Kitasatospora sp. NPDC002040]|uniref:serine/threonine-protein kinase n=1 Tax=Kitasatospora sp. NPDC002040 TaxID=3154661 RepID=UPI003333F475